MNYDAVVIGDGIAGVGAALGLVRYRKKVLVLGRKDLGGASTPRAAGILDPFLEMNARSPLFKIACKSFHDYPRWIQSLGASLEKAGYQTTGMLYIAMNRAEEKELRRRLAWQKKCGIPVRWLSASEIFKKEPLVSRDLIGGLFYPSIPRVQPEKLMKVLAAQAHKKNVTFLRTKMAAKVILSKGRVIGVRVGKDFIQAPVVIQASGAWAKTAQPVRGQILIVKHAPKKISTILHSLDGGYIVPWDRESLLLGSTVERAGFHPVTTQKALSGIRCRIERIAPSLKNAKILDSWAGLRPFSKTSLPIIGKGRVEGLYWATGYYRSGILISGLAGELLAKGIVTGKMPAPLKPFSYE